MLYVRKGVEMTKAYKFLLKWGMEDTGSLKLHLLRLWRYVIHWELNGSFHKALQVTLENIEKAVKLVIAGF